MTTIVRKATTGDASAIWWILKPVFRAGETYSIARDIEEADAIAYWCGPSHETFVTEVNADILGTYYLRANQGGGGDHVANCGYVTSSQAQGQGIARLMLEHSLVRAKERGFLAMQFNFVVSTNEGGPALGYFQMEPKTHDDIWKNYLGFDKSGLAAKMLVLAGLNTGVPAADPLKTKAL